TMMNNDLTLHTDKYQINMMYEYWKNNTHLNRVIFEVYFRRNLYKNGYTIFAGLERIIQYMNQLTFTEEDLAYLASQEENYDEDFLEELRNFSFKGNMYAVQEGEIVFPNEPLIRVEGTVFEAQ